MADNRLDFGTGKISKILFTIAPPVMLAQLIQALYNIVDSFFVGRFSQSGLTALSIIYPVQLLMIAFAVGIGVGINTAMAAKLGVGQKEQANRFAGVGTPLILGIWLVFALLFWFLLPFYARMSSGSEAVIRDVVLYGRIVCLFSVGLFLESVWTKILQAEGDMKTPMFAQILGAITNIVLDPLLIFGLFGLPRLGIAGAAIATVTGQIAAALVVRIKGFRPRPAWKTFGPHIRKIFHLGVPSILMQSAYTFYILGLNLILATFSDQAVTALGIYYKWQTFFFIPLNAMTTCIVPIISFNYAARNLPRCKKTLTTSILFGLSFMSVGALCFECIPAPMLQVFHPDPAVVEIGVVGFRFIGVSFLPIVTALILTVFFQAVGAGGRSSLLTIIRTVVLFVPLGYLFAQFGLFWFWLTFPVTETVTSLVGLVFLLRFMKHPYPSDSRRSIPESRPVIQPSHPGVILTIAREHGSGGKEIGKRLAQRLNLPFYYKEMTALAAEESGLDREFISDLNKNAPERRYDLYLSTQAVQKAVTAQYQIIQKIAQEGSCVIVGRAADFVLRDKKQVIRLFLYAPETYRIQRIMNFYGDSREEAAQNLHRSDSARAAYYENISGSPWRDPHHYDLMLDTSCGIDESVEYILKYIQMRNSSIASESKS